MGNYFCGWYFKCQSEAGTAAVIPAFHISGGIKSCSVQLICREGNFFVPFPYESFKIGKNGLSLSIGDNSFGDAGVKLDICTDEFSVSGEVEFGRLSGLRYDIMGPFRFVPFMQCRHSVYSMEHAVRGNFKICGVDYCFDGARGYIEGDRGRSFPSEYAWTQSFFEGGTLMLSVADIPMGVFRFTGVIGIVKFSGKEYRIASYRGAKVVKIRDGEVIVRQGNMTLFARLIEECSHPLRAPVSGDMSRIIRESAECRAAYSFEKNGETIFAFETDRASFEYEYLN